MHVDEVQQLRHEVLFLRRLAAPVEAGDGGQRDRDGVDDDAGDEEGWGR
jgi:hypothetical protein